MNHSIYLRRSNKLYLEKGGNYLSNDYLLNLLANIQSLGYTLSPGLAAIVATLSVEDLALFYDQLLVALKENVGAHVIHKPMYPNFPRQVRQMSEDELYTNAFFHYLGDWLGVRILPGYEKEARTPSREEVRLKVIDLGSIADFDAIFTRLVGAKTSVSDTDKKDIDWFITSGPEAAIGLLPVVIPLRENIAFVIGRLLRLGYDATALMDKHATTATDVLRIATAMSDGDISLAANTRFKNLSKANRRLLLRALENAGNLTEDMLRYKERWKRLGEKLHPMEYKHRFPRCCAAFEIIRNDLPFQTFNGKVEQALLEKDIPGLIGMLQSRPGEMARRLDKLIRTAPNPADILNAFKAAADSVASPVLLQVYAHFRERNTPRALRVFFPKGEVGKAKAIDNNLPPIDGSVREAILTACETALIAKFASYKPLGKVYVDERLKNYPVPFGQRSASKALRSLARGSRIDLPPGDTLRFFIYWKDGKRRTDLDLSALALDAHSGFKMQIAYYNLKDIGGHHSGDITSAPDGASEFIDIDMPACLKAGIRYVLMSVNSFTMQPYCDLPVCFAGCMIRQYPDSGEIYDPLTVENKFDLTANSEVAIPMIIDLRERKYIWTDLSLKANPRTHNNVWNNLSSVTILNKSMTDLVKPDLYHLLTLHVAARGERVLESKEADIIFAPDRGITPSDIDILVSEYL